MRNIVDNMRKRAIHLAGVHIGMWIILMILCIMMIGGLTLQGIDLLILIESKGKF